jgi:RNA polymerase sigma factor (sigma-70 family)
VLAVGAMTSIPPAPKGDPDPRNAVSEAFLRNESALKRFIRRFFRSTPDVEDIAQETFLRAYAVERDRPIEQPRSLLFRIAKHVALTQLTRKSRQITDYIEDSDESEVLLTEYSAEDEVIARQTLALHCEAVAELAPKCREVYLLRKVHGLSHKEISEQLGIAVSTVEKHLIKAVEQCDAYLRARRGETPGREAKPAVRAARKAGLP